MLLELGGLGQAFGLLEKGVYVHFLDLHVVVLAGGDDGLVGQADVLGRGQDAARGELPLFILLEGLGSVITRQIPYILDFP